MSDETLRVLLYSSDRTVREQVRLALGYRVASEDGVLSAFDRYSTGTVSSFNGNLHFQYRFFIRIS